MTPKELREKRARLVENARTKLAEITDKTDAARATEINIEAEAMIAEAEGLAARAETAERLARAEASLTEGDTRRPGYEDGQHRGIETPETLDYRSAFHAELRARASGEPLSPEIRAALAAGWSTLTPEQRAQTAGTPAAGGYLVPEEMMPGLVEAMADWGPMFDDGFATVIKTDSGGSMPIPTLDDTDKQAAETTTEGGTLTDDGSADAVFGRETLEDYMIDTSWIRMSIQLLTGGFMNIEQLLNAKLGERLGRKANAWLTTGTGAGQPQGIVTGAGLGKTVASLSAITADEVLDFVHSVNSAYRRSPKAKAMFNDNTLLALHKLKDGQGNYLLQTAPDGSGLLQIGAQRIKYDINDDMADIGANNASMIFGDMSRYFVRKIGGVVVGSITDKDFWPGIGVAGYARLDGVLTDAAAVKKLVHPAV